MAIRLLDFGNVLHPEHCHESRHFTCLSIIKNLVGAPPSGKW